MQVSGDWLENAATQQVMTLLSAAGHQIYAVGGAVRNAIMGVAIDDVDMACDARPEEVTRLAKAAGLKVIPTGIDHGTVTVLAQGQAFEITTFRRDIETHGRHADVVFSTSIAEDAARRDFTMNALYARADGTVLDPLGKGVDDAKTRNLRFIGDAHQRIREDYLRILRFFRFYAYYGAVEDGINADGLAACAELAEGISTLSRERIGMEMSKLLQAPDPAPAIAAMAQAGVLAQVVPQADAKALPILIHAETQTQQPAHWLTRLAVLGGEEVTAHLRLSNAQAKRLDAIRTAALDGPSPAVMGHILGKEWAVQATLARAALTQMLPSADVWPEITRGATTPFPITAADLMPAFTGPALGAEMKRMKDIWLKNGLHQTRADLLGQ